MYRYEQIKTIHLELTSKCNAACPQCPRSNEGGKLKEHLHLTELSLDDVVSMFPVDFIERVEHIMACGNFGDPIMARDTLEIFEYFVNINPQCLYFIYTNGSAKPAKWWYKLGKLFAGKNHDNKVIFAIDGLEDTNHIYRRNTKWSIIMRNMKAFMDGGGTPRWDYIVFKHNEHQVEEAQALADDLGIIINFKKTGRFIDQSTLSYVDSTPVRNKKNEIVGKIERPVAPKWQNEGLANLKEIKKQYGNIKRYLDTTKITCKAKEEKSVYITADGLVLPCCWVGNGLLQPNSRLSKIINEVGGPDMINCKIHNLETILNGPFFQQKVPESWSKPSLEDGRLIYCAKICGEIISPQKSQSKIGN